MTSQRGSVPLYVDRGPMVRVSTAESTTVYDRATEEFKAAVRVEIQSPSLNWVKFTKSGPSPATRT